MTVRIALKPGDPWPFYRPASAPVPAETLKPAPQPPAAPAKKQRSSKNVRLGEGGTEHYCSRCKDWWPADLEFFYPSSSGRNGLHDWCKACYREWRANTTGKARHHSSTVVVAPPAPGPLLASVPWLGSIAPPQA